MFAQEAAALSSRIGESLDQELVAEALTDGTAEEEINNARLAEAGTYRHGLGVYELDVNELGMVKGRRLKMCS